MRAAPRPLPVATILITAATGLVAAAGFLNPVLQESLRRDPSALAAGEWRRLATPLLVRTDGWVQLVVILTGTPAAGTVVEQTLGWRRLLVLYLAGGLAGQAAGYVWDPTGAGSSVAMLGLFSGVWLLLLRQPGPSTPPVRLVGAAGVCLVLSLVAAALIPGALAAALVGVVTGSVTFNLLPRVGGHLADHVIGVAALAAGIALTLLHDNHGPAILAGAATAALLP